MLGKFNCLNSLEQCAGLVPDVSPDAFAVAPEFDSTEQLRVEIYDNEESCPVRYTSDVHMIYLIVHLIGLTDILSVLRVLNHRRTNTKETASD